MPSHADRARERYSHARQQGGYSGTRAEFMNLVMRCPALFRVELVECVKDWFHDQGGPSEHVVEARNVGRMDQLGPKGTMHQRPGSTWTGGRS